MEGKSKEVRITILVVAVLFVIVVIASFWTTGVHLVTGGGSGKEDVSTVDQDTVQEASSAGSLVMPGATEGRTGPRSLNNKLLIAEAYRPAADSGDAEAQFKMGEAYSNGQRVPADPTAMIWYRKSAAQGWPAAQNRLAIIYLEGSQKPSAMVVAYALSRLAASHPLTPSAQAQERLTELTKTMDAKQREEGEALADALADLDDFLRTLDRAAK